jgi:Flp pilus assembly protein TadD
MTCCFENPRALPRRAIPLFLSLTAVLLGGCANGGLETGALQLNNPDAAAPAAETATASPNAGWQANVARAPDTSFTVKAETAALIRKARAIREGGDKTKALAMLDEAPEADKDPALIKERGLLTAELGQLDKAQSLLRKAQDAKAPDWRVYSALGATLSAQGKQAEARAEFNKALELAPDHPAILNNLALTYAMEGKHQDAEKTLRKAVAQTDAGPQSKQNLAIVLGLEGNMEEARKVSTEALPPEKAAANLAYLAKLKKPNVAVSHAETGTVEAVKAASIASDGDRPIMQLGGVPN